MRSFLPSAPLRTRDGLILTVTDYNRLSAEEAMLADRVEFSWDEGKSSWLLRIESGEEVIRRHCTLPKNADENTLRTAIEKAVADEGYEVDRAKLVRR